MSLLSKFFGGKKSEETPLEAIVKDTLEGLFERAQFELQYEISIKPNQQEQNVMTIELSGPDEELIKNRDGQVIDALQLFVKRVVQHHIPDDQTHIQIDCGGFREETEAALVEMADRLKEQALEKGKSVYFRALPPRDRKVIHQHLANDGRVKSRSIGDGLFKKIKIYPVKGSEAEDRSSNE